MSKISVKDNKVTVSLTEPVSEKSCAKIIQQISDALADGKNEVTVDLSKLKKLNYFGVAMIIAIYKSVLNAEGVFKLTKVPEAFQAIINYCRLERYFEIE